MSDYPVNASLERPPALASRVAGHVVSYVFHPLFIPVYMAAFLLFVHPLLFAGLEHGARLRLLATVFVNLTLLPAITAFLCWRLGFVDSLQMKTVKERIIPLAAAMIFYFWCWFVLRNFVTIPVLFRQFLFGSFLTVIAAWLCNIYFKVSLHGLGVGGAVGFMCLLVFGYDGGSGLYLGAALLAAGLVCSARMVVGTHRPGDIYAGFFVGILCQLIAPLV